MDNNAVDPQSTPQTSVPSPPTPSRRFGAGRIALVVVGALLLIIAIALPTVVVPSLEKMPAEIDSTGHFVGEATVLNQQTFKPQGPLPAAVERSYKTVSTEGNVEVLDRRVVTTIGGQPFGEPAVGVFAVDRTTGQHVAGHGSNKQRNGQALGMPWHAQKITYPFWDESAGRTLPASFVDEQTLQGLDVYKYSIKTDKPLKIGEQQVPGAALGAPGMVTLDIIYSRDGTLLVDPLTGTPVSGSDHTTIALAMPGTTTPVATVADITAHQTDAGVTETIDTVKSGHQLLSLVRVTIPVVAGIVGLLLIGLALRRRRAA